MEYYCIYLLFLWTVSRLHFHLQRNGFPNTLPLRQAVLVCEESKLLIHMFSYR